ncbi:uncharacterized protein [Oryza sativa Japonica Group]|jgi:hypothetical protein|uniref:cDNA clone:001-010-D04, full insert sequence n=8 Tax=Oryza TaxID=4527 RepID=Q6Z878_ORYSJ|nr:uncharacterized protein LOC4329181 [Oryza sativa Japonica Group]XP_052141448.1 uncharacterized protein LOC127761227 [Oryza glaberrima]EAY85624.1 hypothetical protein OsI_06997 [Oryza sativa Indica Group]EAZ22820.1 hypothetical protein OsJ_06497 [Oryza sativa Japonica Group]KAF2944489.1 hypothetical protein DAI22_02g146800 [Oryza sativa Japonica Group]BAD15683.1 unknown protein [Oryza sativa Japonica Group]BAF08613.1 Os02g0324700 [Oryza sativa Japonica Group]|eukprot:NP_001046699.1 Os02g0324700 [Oryza sativa Japonica Group]
MMKLGKAESARGKVAPAGSGGRARMLVTVTVLGSAGPLRFLIDEGETVAGLIRAALRCYAREGRMPLLGADAAGFLLYTANGGSDALSADEKIYFNGCRSFLLWQKAARDTMAKGGRPELANVATCNPCKKRGGGGWKGGLNKFLLSFSFKV